MQEGICFGYVSHSLEIGYRIEYQTRILEDAMQENRCIRGIASITGFSILAKDGEIGRVSDLYFDNQQWVARYLIIDTGEWLAGRQLLLPPMAIQSIDWDNKSIFLNLSKDQIEASPAIAFGEQITQQWERDLFANLGWSGYWNGDKLWGKNDVPDASFRPSVEIAGQDTPIEQPSSHLTRAVEVIGYRVQGLDDGLGNISDLLVDDHSWEIRWMMVDTRPWWFGGNVLVNIKAIDRMATDTKSIHVNLTKEEVRDCPELQIGETLTIQEEQDLMENHKILRKAA